MPRGRRYIESEAVYELCFRARDSLPLIAYKLINFVIECVLARSQRDEKVVLCHDIWNGSHPHLIVVSKDAQKLVNFSCEVQKKITDIIKRLLGLDHLNIWEGTPSVIKIGDLEAAKERISYLYANPGQDDLEESIELFPGLSSWKEFEVCMEGGLGAEVKSKRPWIRLPTVPKLSSPTPSRQEDLEVIETLLRANKKIHDLVRSPNAWMKCFGVKEESVKEVNFQVVQQLREKEAKARDTRVKENKVVLGSKALTTQPLLKAHSPKKRGRKIFIITRINEIRLDYIAKIKAFRAKCRDCLKRWKAGELSMAWPPEAFKPSLPPTVSIFAT